MKSLLSNIESKIYHNILIEYKSSNRKYSRNKFISGGIQMPIILETKLIEVIKHCKHFNYSFHCII